MKRALRLLSDLRLTMACTLLLMVLVFLCTLDQARLGVYAAVAKYIRSFIVWGTLPGVGFRVPLFPGGALIGLVYLGNLIASLLTRLALDRRHAGLWLVHLGLALLVTGEFAAGAWSVESRLALREGQTLSYSESPRRSELAVIDSSAADFDRVLSVDEGVLARGGEIRREGWPFTFRVLRWVPNASLVHGVPGAAAEVSMGAGAGLSIRPLPRAASDEEVDAPAALVELRENERVLGVWLLARGLEIPQEFTAGGRAFRFLLRARRHPLPFALTLLDFKRETYPGSDIPKSFSSGLRLRDEERGEDREVLVSMNNPLRYRGLSFYQASFGEDDRLSILQVVENPGRLLPYLACVLAGLGLLLHFGRLLWLGGKP